MVDAVLSVAVDPSGVEQGARVVRRSLEDIDRSANSSMSAMDRYNAHLGKGASAADIFQRQMQGLEAQMRAAEQAAQTQARVVNELSMRFDVVRAAAKSAVSSLQDFGRTKFSGEITAQMNRLASDMVGAMDRGGRGAVSAARASQREIITLAKSHLDEQLALVREEAHKRVAGAQAEWERVKELHKGAKTEIAAQERAAAEQALSNAKKSATDSIAAAKGANVEILADLKARTEQIITLKQRETTVHGEYERGLTSLARTEQQLEGSLTRLLATEQAHAQQQATQAQATERLLAVVRKGAEARQTNATAIQAETDALREQATVAQQTGRYTVSNAGLVSADLPAPAPVKASAQTGTDTAPLKEERVDVQALGAELDKLILRYDYATAAVHRRTEALETLSAARKAGILDDDAEYQRLQRLITGEDERARQQAQAAERVAMENDRVADSYASVMGKIDPAVAAQQRYDAALKQVLDYHRSVHSSTEIMAADMDRVKAAMSPAAVAAREEAAALQALEDRLDKAGVAARRLAEEQARLDGARDRGDLSPERHAALTKVLNEEGAAHHNAARGAVSHMRAAQLLVPQLSDVFTTAAMGMNPLMILVQQGPQIVDVLLLAGKEAALAAARFALLATPVLAFTAAFAVAAYGMARFFDDVREAERVARLTGNAAGITASQFVSMTDAIGASRGISNAAARDIATAYIGTGKIGGQVLSDLTAFTKDYAVATSQDVGKASEGLAGMFSSPAKAAEEAAQKWGMFSDAQVQTIRNYEAQGQLERAQQALLEGLKPRIDGAADKVAWYTKLWDDLGQAISNAADAAGRYGAGPQTDAERTTALQKDIALWKARVAADPNGTTVVDGTRVRDADMLQQAKDALARELRDQQDREAKAASDRKAAEFNRLQSQAMNLARSVDPAITATHDLKNAEVLLEKAVAAGAMSLQEKTRALNLYKTQLEQTAEPAKAFALEMERQARVTEASVGRARDFEQQRQEILKKRGAMPGEALTQSETDQINEGLNRRYAAQAAERHRSMQEAIQDAQRLGAATASLSQPTIIAAQAETEFFRVLRETSDYKKAKQAEDDALTKGMIEFNAQVDASIATGQLAVASAQRLADAQARGGDIAMARARSENVLAEQLARGVDPVKALTLAALDYQKSLADLSAQQRAWNRDIAEQTDAARRLAQAEAESGAAVAEANIQNKVRAQILKEGVELDSTRAQAIEAGTRALEAQNAAARVNSSIRQGNQDLALVRAEYDMLGMSNAERERSVAIMRAQLEVQNSGDWAQVPQETRDAWIAQAGAVAEYRTRVADATEASRDFANVIGKGFEDAVLAGGKLSDILKGLQSDIERIFLRATVTKPLENWLTGTMTKVLAPAPANDNVVQPVNDNDPGGYRSLFEGLTSSRTGAIGSQGNPMWVRFASAGGAALDLNSFATQANSGPVPVAVKDAGDLEGVIQSASTKYGVDANTIKALIQQESTWNPTAVNPRSGAAGLMQIMPANWSAYGVTNPFDPAQNVDAGTRIFREHLDRAGGDLERALSTFGGFITKSSDGYVASVKANKAAYDQAATSTVTLASAQTQAASAASVFSAEQRKVIDAALGSQKATADATNQQDALTDGLGHFRESLEAETKSRDQAVRATQQLTQAQQTAAAGMVGGTQAALGGIMSLLGGITGAGTVSVGGSVISAGGPQGISSALGSLWNGISGGSFGDTSLSGVKSWLNSTAWGGNVASKTAPVAKAGNGMLAGGEGAQTGMGTAPATPAVSWGNVVGGGMTAVGGAMQMARAQNAGQSIGGAAQMAGGVMMMIPGLQVVGGLVALGGTLISAFSSGNSRGDPYSVTNLSVQGGRFKRGTFDADNDGDPTKFNSAVEQVATKLNTIMDTYGLKAGNLTNVAVGERDATPEQAMLRALRSLQSDNKDVAWVLANAVGDDIDAAVKAIDFAAKFRDTITLWNSGMDSIVAATQQGTAAANAFGKTVLAFLDGAAATYDVAALTAKAGGKTGNAALDKLLANLPGYATGTSSAQSGWAVVGEEGPELVKLAGGERIWNARDSAQMLAGLGEGRDDALIHIRSTDELAKIRRALGHSGRVNPVTGLLGFDDSDSDSDSNGVAGGERDTPGSGTSAGDTGSGYGSDHGGGGGFGGFLSAVADAINSLSNTVAEALGLDAKEAAVLGGMVGITGTVAIGGIRGFAEAVGKGIASVTGPGEAAAVAGPGDPGMSPTGGDFAAADAVLTKLLDALKADPTGAVATNVMGGLEAGATGYTVAQIAGGSSDAYLAGVRGQGGEAKVAALAEDLDAAVQSIAAAGVAIPDVLRSALEKTNAYATSLGITPASEKRETSERLFNSALGEQGLSTGRYGEVMGVVQSLADGTFSAVGKDFQALADDMVKSMAAMSSAGMQVPPALEAAEKRMLALVAAKARIDAEIAGITDTSTDYQKQVAQLSGYWSMASTDLVKAMQAVGYEGDVLTQKLGEGLKNALKKLNEEAAKVFDTNLRSAQGRSYIDEGIAIRKRWNEKWADDLAVSRNPNDMYKAQTDALFKGLSVDQLGDMVDFFRDLDPVMSMLAGVARDAARTDALADLDQRFKAAQVSLGQLSQEEYDRYELNLKHTNELADVTDVAVRARLLEVQAIEKQAKAEEALAEQRKAQIAAGGSVRSWLDQQRATAGTSVSPQDARDAAQAQFARDLALARGGDVDAYGRLTGAADRLLSSQEALTASGTETQTMRAWVMSSLENLPATKSYDQQMLEELRKLGGSVNVQVELTTVRIITEQLSALSDADKAKLTQAAVVLRTVEERIGRFLTDAELGRLVDNALVTRDVQQTLGRDLTDAERTALVGGGNVLRTVEQLMGRTLTAVEVESIVQSGSVSRSIEQAIGRSLTAAEVASIVEAGAVTRSIGQFLARDLSAPEVAALVVGGAVERMVAQQLGRDLTDAERAGLVTAATVIRSVEQQLGRPLTAAEQAAIILPGSVQRIIGQQIDPATGAVLVPGGTVTRTVTQSVETTETVQISRSIDDKLSGILASIKESSAGINTSAAGMQELLERAVDGDGLMVRTRPTGDPRQWVAFERGGVVPGFENGGIVANGIPGRDSVVARGPGGMPIWLAGLEGILTASATAAIGGKPTIDYINQHHALPGWGSLGYEAGGIAPPANDLWAPNVTPARRHDYAPAPSRSGSDERTAAELRLLRQAVERLARILERNEGMDQEQRAKIAQQHAEMLDRIADAAEVMEKKMTGTGGF